MQPKKLSHRPFLLLILDGWGYSTNIEDNAIAQACTPHWDRIWAQYPHALISGSGADVGLPDGQMGNSEVGHLNMGAGCLVPQDLGRINMAIQDGSFDRNPVFTHAIKKAVSNGKAIHILGLLSPGGVHSHEKHIQAFAALAAKQGATKIYLHAFLDGRDTPPKSALASLQALDAELRQLGHGQIASLCGRYYAMDRDKRWERTQLAYDLLTQGTAEYHAATAEQGLAQAYARGETDEFVKPTAIRADNAALIHIADGDAVFFMNYRSDRARQLSHALLDADFTGFKRQVFPKLGSFVTLTEYATDIHSEIAYPPLTLHNVLGEYIANLGYRQLRIAETEKYAHVTFFFNGGIETPFANEDRILVPSPKVATYDLKPEMSAPELTDKLVEAITSEKYDLIICNYANADMVGHSGIMPAAIKAVEAIDAALGKIIPALKSVGGEMLITADHGNAEQMQDHTTHQPHTAHTSNPVPLIYIGRKATFTKQHGTLCDVAPTLLNAMGLPQPKEMTGHNLLAIE
ncbi:MAG: 2,3-bisphosphoglycerate-independent phosphoglycerate mutase [Gammaproteobacteria bacterium]|nr:2,3-bisphosphoglycerate-independent phosphoglycerate mutase [Gammaproteobacteria bacterium]